MTQSTSILLHLCEATTHGISLFRYGILQLDHPANLSPVYQYKPVHRLDRVITLFQLTVSQDVKMPSFFLEKYRRFLFEHPGIEKAHLASIGHCITCWVLTAFHQRLNKRDWKVQGSKPTPMVTDEKTPTPSLQSLSSAVKQRKLFLGPWKPMQPRMWSAPTHDAARQGRQQHTDTSRLGSVFYQRS